MSDREEKSESRSAAAAEPGDEASDTPAADVPEATASERADDAAARARADWGFPRFAKDFPRHPELDALVEAFARGDYRTVRDRAPALAERAEDEQVKRAARTLAAHLEADPTAKLLFALTFALLAFLTVWWITHDGPPPEQPAPPTAPTVEFVR